MTRCSRRKGTRTRSASADAVEASLEAIANSKLNPLTFLDAEGARRQAEQIDARIPRGEDPGLLAGVPVLVKDVEDAAGWPTTRTNSCSTTWQPSTTRFVFGNESGQLTSSQSICSRRRRFSGLPPQRSVRRFNLGLRNSLGR